MNKFQSKRFTLIIASFIVVSAMGMIAMFTGMEAVAVTCATGLCALIGYYVKQETDRPSGKENGK